MIIKLVFLVVVADLLMSFDNAIVIADIASHANNLGWEIFMIVFALLFSFPIILFGANTFGKIMHENKWVPYFASFLLVSIGLEMIFESIMIWTDVNLNEIQEKFLLNRLPYLNRCVYT